MSQLLDLVRERVVIYDGAMGTSILNCNSTPQDYGGIEGCNEYLVFVQPRHRSRRSTPRFLEVGVDVLETDTFGGSLHQAGGVRPRRADLRAQPRPPPSSPAASPTTTRPPATRASSPARSARPACCPPPKTRCSASTASSEVVELFLDQVRGLVDGGAIVLIIETIQDILELKAAVHAILRVRDESGSLRPDPGLRSRSTPAGRMLLGTDIAAALAILEALPVDVVGLNCSTGPEHMREPARYLGEHATRPVAIIPNAGIPINVNGLAVFPLEPEPMARDLREMVEEFGVGIVGGCCGTTPEHLDGAGRRRSGAGPSSAAPARSRCR